MTAVAEPIPEDFAIQPAGVPVVGAADALSLEARFNEALLVPLAVPVEPPVPDALSVAPFRPGIWPVAPLVAVTVPLGRDFEVPSAAVPEPVALYAAVAPVPVAVKPPVPVLAAFRVVAPVFVDVAVDAVELSAALAIELPVPVTPPLTPASASAESEGLTAAVAPPFEVNAPLASPVDVVLPVEPTFAATLVGVMLAPAVLPAAEFTEPAPGPVILPLTPAIESADNDGVFAVAPPLAKYDARPPPVPVAPPVALVAVFTPLLVSEAVE